MRGWITLASTLLIFISTMSITSQAQVADQVVRHCMESGRDEQALFCGERLSETERRQHIWAMFENQTAQIRRCEHIYDCQKLVEAFRTKDVTFIVPTLRASSADNVSFRKALPSCLDQSFYEINIFDSRVEFHRDRAVGPVSITALEPSRGTRWRPAVLVELHGFQRLDPAEDESESEFEPFHVAKVMDTSTCEILLETTYSQGGLIDVGLFRHGNDIYRYLIGRPPGMNYHFVIFHKDGVETLAQLQPKAFIYMEWR